MITSYPYSCQIIGFLLFDIIVLIMARNRINWNKYWKVNLVCVIWGIVQINALENYMVIPAWDFFDGVSYWCIAFGNVYWDDIGFVFVCCSLFYWFLFKIRNIPDVISPKYYIWIICALIVGETQLYHICGQGGKDLILVYTLIPILLFIFYCIIKKYKPNVTQMLVFFGLVCAISVPWEILNALVGWWYYNNTSDAFSLREFWFCDLIPLGITPQYSISGSIVMYSIWTVLSRKNHGKHSQRSKKTR